MRDTKSLKAKVIENLSFSDVGIKIMEDADLKDLQHFLDLLKDFFFICEGASPSAKSILEAYPPSCHVEDDKVCLGLYQSERLIGLLDLVQHYPTEGALTIGYFLIHPSLQSQGNGSKLIHQLAIWAIEQGFEKLRVVVQRQNPRALSFWQQAGFVITETVTEKLGKMLNMTDVCELRI